MYKKDKPRYDVVKFRVTSEQKQGFLDFANDIGGNKISDALAYFISIGLMTSLKHPDPIVRKASKKFWKDHWKLLFEEEYQDTIKMVDNL